MKDILGVIVGIGIFIVSIIASIAIPVLIVVGGIWLYNDVIKDEPKQTSSLRDDVEVKQDYTPNRVSDTLGYEFEQAFVDGCSTEASRSACQCMYDYLDSTLTNDEFLVMANLSEQQLMTNENIINAAVRCS